MLFSISLTTFVELCGPLALPREVTSAAFGGIAMWVDGGKVVVSPHIADCPFTLTARSHHLPTVGGRSPVEGAGG